MTNAYNKQLSQLDYTLFPNAQDAWDKFKQQQGMNGVNIAGLNDTQSGKDFDSGLATYDTRVNDMYNNAGYSADEKAGINNSTTAGFAAPYAAGANDVKLQQARTGNSAGVNGSIAGLARDRGRMISAGLAGNQKAFGDARIAGQNQAMSLSQFPQLARLQRMQGERDTAGLGLQQSQQNLSAYQGATSAQLGAAGIRGANIANNPSFLSQLSGGIAGSLGKLVGSAGSAGLASL